MDDLEAQYFDRFQIDECILVFLHIKSSLGNNFQERISNVGFPYRRVRVWNSTCGKDWCSVIIWANMVVTLQTPSTLLLWSSLSKMSKLQGFDVILMEIQVVPMYLYVRTWFEQNTNFVLCTMSLNISMRLHNLILKNWCIGMHTKWF